MTFLLDVEGIYAAIADASRLGGNVVQERARVPGVAFALTADPAGRVIGLASRAEPSRWAGLAGSALAGIRRGQVELHHLGRRGRMVRAHPRRHGSQPVWGTVREER